jgi:hypothetical protein
MKTQKQALQSVLDSVSEQRKLVQETFYYLDEEQLTKKPTQEKWSALQCMEHLNLCNLHYLTEIKKALPNLKSGDKDKAYKKGLIGGYMIKSMAPKNGTITNPMKTFKNVRPLTEREEGATVKAQPTFTDFFADLDEYEKIAKELEGKDIQSAKVISLIGPLVKFKVGDALLFMMAHNDRHILQAINALQST